VGRGGVLSDVLSSLWESERRADMVQEETDGENGTRREVGRRRECEVEVERKARGARMGRGEEQTARTRPKLRNSSGGESLRGLPDL